MMSNDGMGGQNLSPTKQAVSDLEDVVRALEQELLAFNSGVVTQILEAEVRQRMTPLWGLRDSLNAHGPAGKSLVARIEQIYQRLERMAERAERAADGKLARMQEWEQKYEELWGKMPGPEQPLEDRIAYALLQGSLTLLWASSRNAEAGGLLARAAKNMLDVAKSARAHMPRAPLSDPPPKPKR